MSAGGVENDERAKDDSYEIYVINHRGEKTAANENVNLIKCLICAK